MLHTRIARRILIVCASGFLGACASGPVELPPDYLSTSFDAGAVDRVHLLPALDHRIDKSKELKLDDWLAEPARRTLAERGYSAVVMEDRALVEHITRDDLEAPDANWVGSLGPPSGRWIMLLVLEDSVAKTTFGSSGSAEMTGYLFDRQNGILVWKNKETGQFGQGGLIGMAMKGMMERSAIEMAAMQLFQGLPLRGESS